MELKTNKDKNKKKFIFVLKIKFLNLYNNMQIKYYNLNYKIIFY